MGRPIAAVLLFSLTLAGCATGYNDLKNPLSLTGGYWDEPGPGKLVKVGFAGNAFIEREQVERYLVRRAAEVAQRQGASHFLMYSSLPNAIADRPSMGRSVATIGGKPVSYVYILPITEPNSRALAVKDVMDRVAPEVALRSGS
jgi:hypothetical protein